MFVRSDEIYDKGSEFFKTPTALFKRYIEDLYKMRPQEDRDKFLALVILWSKEDKVLSREEISRVKTASDHVKRIAEVFDRVVDVDLLETVRLSLDSHVGGFLKYTDRTGLYAFNHNIIADMVGLVIARKKPEQAVEICPRDFLMEFVRIGERQENKVTLIGRQYPCLVEKMADVILRQTGNKTVKIFDTAEFNTLVSNEFRQNDIEVYSEIDYGVIKHQAFRNEQFIEIFIDYMVEHNCVDRLLQTPIMSVGGFFLDYGIMLDTRIYMYLLEYAWFVGARVFAENISKRFTAVIKGPSVCLLLAVHSGDIESVRYLLKNGARVTGDAIYIAVHKQTEILEVLLSHPDTDVNDRGNAVNGNYPLIIATRKGFTEAVKCLLKHGADPSVRNDSNMTAVHKAIVYRRKEVLTDILDMKGPLDVKGGLFKRTPLHMAVDVGDAEVVRVLLRYGAPVLIKDRKGQFPIHIAAFKRLYEIVRILLPVDNRQTSHRLSSYGELSKMKGMSLCHIAVWMKDAHLLGVLMEMGVDPNNTDWFGQTPLYMAIMNKEEHIVDMLLKNRRTDKQKGQKQGFTPLHAAINKELTDIALSLIPHSNVNAKDKFGKTPLHCACEKGNTRVIERLLEFKADIRIITKRGDTVFHIIRRQMRKDGPLSATAKQLEKYFTMYDPEFVKQLPALENKANKVVAIVSDFETDRIQTCPPLHQFLRGTMTMT